MLDLSAEAAAQLLRDVPRLARSAPGPLSSPHSFPPPPHRTQRATPGPRRAVAKATGCDGVMMNLDVYVLDSPCNGANYTD